MSYTYAYNLPGSVVWSLHIIVGLIISFIGYNQLVDGNMIVWSKARLQTASIVMVVLGAMMALYHLHLWLFGVRDQESGSGSTLY